MLAGKRASMTDYQVGGAINEGGVVANSGLAQQIKTHAHVDAAMTKVSIERGLIVVFIQQLAYSAQVATEFFRCDRRVVPSFPFRRSPGRKGSGTRSGFTNLPNELCFCAGVNARAGRNRQALHGSHELLRKVVRFIAVICAEFDKQKPMTLRQKLNMRIISAFEAIYDAAFKAFQPDRLKGQYLGHVIGCDEHVWKAKRNQCAVLRTVNQSQLCFQYDCACAFSSHQRMSEVKTVFGQQFIQIVARHSSRNTRITGTNPCSILVTQGTSLCVNLATTPAGANGGVNL